ncbi:MAG: hypothetical protein AABZ47_14465 [Planctomycetota bacterium]
MTRHATLNRKWRRWIKLLEDELGTLLDSRHIFRGLKAMVLDNEAIQKPRAFHDWVTRNYCIATWIGIRRLMDEDRRSISVIRLLNDIEKNADYLTKESYVRRYPLHSRKAGEQSFDRNAGNRVDRLPVTVPQTDRDDLKKRLHRLERFITKRIAHYDIGSDRRAIPSMATVDSALDRLDKILMKYMLLIKGSAPQTAGAESWTFNWTDIFHVPWISDPNKNYAEVRDVAKPTAKKNLPWFIT